MASSNNPFFRGYQNLKISRELLITYENDCPPAWRTLHSSQAHLRDEDVACFPCIFNDDFVLITEGTAINDDIREQCNADGIVRSVVYAITGEDADGCSSLIGDVYSPEAATAAVERLSFETGFYSRCWEISTAHLTETSRQFLCEMADGLIGTNAELGMLFVTYRIPASPAIGIKLIATPWSSKHLLEVENITAEGLQLQHQLAELPADLVLLLHLAGRADVRMLVFDADASILDDLPVYEP